MKITQKPRHFDNIIIGATPLSIAYGIKHKWPIIYRRVYPPDDLLHNMEYHNTMLIQHSMEYQDIICATENEIRIDAETRTISVGSYTGRRAVTYNKLHIFDVDGVSIKQYTGEDEPGPLLYYYEFKVQLSNRVKEPKISFGNGSIGLNGNFFDYYRQKTYSVNYFTKRNLRRGLKAIEQTKGVYTVVADNNVTVNFYNHNFQKINQYYLIRNKRKHHKKLFTDKLNRWDRVLVKSDTQLDKLDSCAIVESMFTKRYEVSARLSRCYDSGSQIFFSPDLVDFVNQNSDTMKLYNQYPADAGYIEQPMIYMPNKFVYPASCASRWNT